MTSGNQETTLQCEKYSRYKTTKNLEWKRKSNRCFIDDKTIDFLSIKVIDIGSAICLFSFYDVLPAAKWSGDDFLPAVSLRFTLELALTILRTFVTSPFLQASNNSLPPSQDSVSKLWLLCNGFLVAILAWQPQSIINANDVTTTTTGHTHGWRETGLTTITFLDKFSWVLWRQTATKRFHLDS